MGEATEQKPRAPWQEKAQCLSLERSACFGKTSPSQQRKEGEDGPGHRDCAYVYHTCAHATYCTTLTSITLLILYTKLHTRYIVHTHYILNTTNAIAPHIMQTYVIPYAQHTILHTDITHTHPHTHTEHGKLTTLRSKTGCYL